MGRGTEITGPITAEQRVAVEAVLTRRELARLGGECCAIIDAVPQWWLDGHRKEPTGHPPGRPTGAKDRKPRSRRAASLPAHT